MIIAGVDEAGRGALAGPVVAGAVIFPDDFGGDEFQDSKKISDKKRRELLDLLKKHCDYGVGVVSAQEIDAIGIKPATNKAMRLAVSELKSVPEQLLIDGRDKFQFDIPSFDIVKGDEFVSIISAASIVAKVWRDDIMKKMHKKYPEFDFVNNKGYGAQKHLELLAQEIYCPEHRTSYDPLFTYLTQGRLF